MLTQGLFYEWNNPDAPFTLRDTGLEEYYVARSGKKYQSFAYLFRQHIDEYDFAINVLGSWEHWKKLCGEKWFLEGTASGHSYTGLNDWREERQRKDQMLAKKVLLEKIEDGDLQAAKFLYTESSKGETKGKGRPSKEIPKKHKSNVASIARDINKRSQG